MKKLFFIAAIASVALVSCTKNDFDESPTTDKKIEFAAPVVSPTTKGTLEVWNNYPQAAAYNFAVWAKYFPTGTYTTWAGSDVQTYMEEVPVAFADNTWAPAQAYYWPKNGSLTFIAYSPASKESYAEATDSGITFTNYDVSTTVDKQVDLMFSERAYNKKAVDDNEAGSGDTSNDSTVTGDPYKGVHLSFKHALSSVAFTAKTAADYSGSTTITLNKIELVNVGSIASFDQNLADANNAPTTAAAWTATTGPVTYVVDNDDDLAQVLNTTAWWSANKSTTAPAKADGLRDTDFILLPQDLSANNVKIKITYTLDNAGAGSEALVQVIEQDLATAAVSKWEMGKRYIYNIIVGLDTIFFEPYVADWEDVPAGGAGQNFNF